MNTAVAIIRLIMAELGKTTPIFTAALGLSNPAETSIFRWGDGSSLNEGEVDVAYIGIGAWKKYYQKNLFFLQKIIDIL